MDCGQTAQISSRDQKIRSYRSHYGHLKATLDKLCQSPLRVFSVETPGPVLRIPVKVD